ncbi:MAG: riboflavin biosynthesis protein RibD, partial [Actinomycetota bacterium]
MSSPSTPMLRAIEMASTARRLSPPNPWVGAVVVRNGVIVGEGATSVLGGPHAEVRALASAGDKSRGATLYVTLEPCCHTGRTGPCT